MTCRDSPSAIPRPAPPLSPHKQSSLRIGPEQSRARSEPLTARTDPPPCGTRGKGVLAHWCTRHFHRFHVPSGSAPSGASFPSLPAGINTDDSDPLGAGVGRATSRRYTGPQETPFRGGSLSSSLIFLYRHYGSRIVGANHRKQKTSRNVVVFHPHAFLCHTPPFVPVAKIKVHPVNGEVPPVKGRPWKLPHYANRGKTSSSGGELASARSCFSTVRTALGKLRITGFAGPVRCRSEFSTVPTASATAADYMDKRTGSRFGIRKVPTTSPPPHLPDDPKLSGPLGHEKHPRFGPSNRLRKPGCPKRRIVVNRDPFREIRFGKLSQRHVPLPGLAHPAVLRQKFHVSIVDCASLIALIFLLHRQPLDIRCMFAHDGAGVGTYRME